MLNSINKADSIIKTLNFFNLFARAKNNRSNIDEIKNSVELQFAVLDR
ncbi:hypothetical protein [Bacillus thuringiensis]|nr:hypothetical protein [Bacillus thuringiensis]